MIYKYFYFSLAGLFLHVAFLFALDIHFVSTDKARYAPEESVLMSITMQHTEQAQLNISYFHLHKKIDTATYSPNSDEFKWTWQPPQTDFQGYLAEIILVHNNTPQDTATIAIDVSSNWSKFPRYGFLSKYPYLSNSQIAQTIANLNRYHINGLQFYDWHYKHHMPLKGTLENPASTWQDIANRTIYRQTVEAYIDAAHAHNMQAMAYNLLFGAFENATTDGVSNQWRLFKDSNHSQPDYHPLPSSWASDIYLMDPSNPQWIDYILGNTQDVFNAFKFDGWHIDQLGDRGQLYNYDGDAVNLAKTYVPFIQQAKNKLEKSLVMNAVNQYGQTGIATSPVDFLYTEVWPPNDSYTSLINIIVQNSNWSNGELATVLAAYVNKGQSTQSGFVNTPSVLLADAVIFAAGGAHLELGEHMLANEYFPNDNLKMSDALQEQLVVYYDFLVAYQNLLRDGGSFVPDYMQSADIAIRNRARSGSVWSFAKKFDNRSVFHLINFRDAETMDWRDDEAIQPEPERIENITTSFTSQEKVAAIWMASPDHSGGLPRLLAFTQENDEVQFDIPSLKYWDMVVVEYDTDAAVQKKETSSPNILTLQHNFPNPFNSQTTIRFTLPEASTIRLLIYNIDGQQIRKLEKGRLTAGLHKIKINADGLTSGIYFYEVQSATQVARDQFLLVK